MHLIHRSRHAYSSPQPEVVLGMQSPGTPSDWEQQSGKSASQRLRGSIHDRLDCSVATMPASRRSSAQQLVFHAMLLSAQCCFAAASLTLGSWLLFAGPLHWRIELGYKLPAVIRQLYEAKIVGNMLLRDVSFLWLAPATMAMSAVLVMVCKPLSGHQIRAQRPTTIGRWMARLLPPRALWQWLCGGLTAQDLLAVCFWAAVNVSWFSAAVSYYRHRAVIKAAAKGLASPTGQQMVKAVARSFAATLAPNLTLLFYPVARGSVVLQAVGMSYPAAIRYHRWLGHAVLALVALHGLTYSTVWLYDATWWAEATEQGSGHNNLMGVIGFCFALTLWLTSLEGFRRSNYAAFKVVHHVGFWGFLMAGVCHKWDLVWGFVPGLLLYGIDAVYRIHQALLQPGEMVQVLHADVSTGGGGLCTLVLSSHQFAAAASGYLWLAVPSISYVYHPFEYVAVPWPSNGPTNGAEDGSGVQTALLLHIKAYDRWTKQLLSLVASKGVKLGVKIQGPYADVRGPLPALSRSGAAHEHDYCHVEHSADAVIIVAGGNGITSAASVFQELAASGASTTGLPCLLVWCSRSSEELEVMGPAVLAMANTLQLQLTLKLYFTGNLPAFHPTSRPNPKHISTSAHPTTDLNTSEFVSLLEMHPQPPSDAPAVGALAGGITSTSLCPVVALGSWWGQAGHKLAMHVAVLGGSLCALVLAQHIQDKQTELLGSRWPTAKAGATYIALLVLFILVPGFITLWMTLLLWKWQHRSSRSSRGSYMPVSKSSDDDCSKAATAAIPASKQWPSVTAVAAAAAGAALAGSRGVLSSSPDGMLQLQLPAVQRTLGSTAGDATAEAVQIQQQQQQYEQALCLPVELGRPPLQQLVKGWLATMQQLTGHMQQGQSSSSRAHKLHCCVYAMGPGKLVQGVQQLCDGLDDVHFVRKTHQL